MAPRSRSAVTVEIISSTITGSSQRRRGAGSSNGVQIMDEEIVKRDNQLLVLYPDIEPSLLLWLHENGYFTAPASTKYHGNYEGGLFDHSYTVANTLACLTDDCKLTWSNPRSPVVVGLFHDICKIDQYKHPTETLYANGQPAQEIELIDNWEYNNDTLLKGHGDKSVMMLASLIQLTEEEAICIRYHMGAFTDKSEWNDYTRAIHKYPNVLWTHHADMIASHIVGV